MAGFNERVIETGASEFGSSGRMIKAYIVNVKSHLLTGLASLFPYFNLFLTGDPNVDRPCHGTETKHDLRSLVFSWCSTYQRDQRGS